jgi:hypothetical protein
MLFDRWPEMSMSSFAHDDDGLGSNLTRLGSRAEHLGAVSRVVAQQTFGHLAAG